MGLPMSKTKMGKINFKNKSSIEYCGFLYLEARSITDARIAFRKHGVENPRIEYCGISDSGQLRRYRSKIDEKTPIKWVVYPLNSQGNDIAAPVYVIAKTEKGAERAGKNWLKTLGVKRVNWVSASPMFVLF